VAARRGTRSLDTIDQSFVKEINSTPGGHGGPPLQYVPQFLFNVEVIIAGDAGVRSVGVEAGDLNRILSAT